jgi:hypothetical protein
MMFVQQKKLNCLNMPAKRLRRLYCSTVDLQVALQGFPAQMASAYLASLTAAGGAQIVLGLYLVESGCAVFFLPRSGEVAAEMAEQVLQEGLEFAESMGFVLADADIHRLRPEKLEAYWKSLPICVAPKPVASEPPAVTIAAPQPPATPAVEVSPPPEAEKAVSLEERKNRCRESLGRFLAAL